MDGMIKDARLACCRAVKVNPVKKHYEGAGEAPYIKYVCPVCTAVGNTGVQLADGVTRCPLCGVNLNWKEPEPGDRIKALGAGADGGIFAIERVLPGPAAVYQARSESTGAVQFFTEGSFSVLEPEDGK